MNIGLSSQEPPGQPVIRRHDLDALRGFAMLLGIGLHAAIPYLPLSFDNQPNQSGVFFCTFHSSDPRLSYASFHSAKWLFYSDAFA